MRKRDYTKKQLAVIILLSIGMLAAAALLNIFFPVDSKVTETSLEAVPSPSPAVTATASPVAAPTPDPTEKIATFLQGPKSWNSRLTWSGEWGEAYYDGGSFGGFGCGLCCMANIYNTFTKYECSPIDMYEYAKKTSGYGGGGAIDWGYMKETLKSLGFTSDVWRKPKNYAKFQQMVKDSMACIVVVSSYDSECYWKNTPGHYVTLFAYDEATDKIFLGDSGDPQHNRHWVPLKKVYRSLKTSNNWQYLAVTAYDAKKDRWKHRGFGGNCVLPEGW